MNSAQTKIRTFEIRCLHGACKAKMTMTIAGSHKISDPEAEFDAIVKKAGWGEHGHCPDHDMFPWRS